MPTYDLGTVTASNRAAQFLKDSFEREAQSTLTVAQIIKLIRQGERNRLAMRVVNERRLQREEGVDDSSLNREVTI